VRPYDRGDQDTARGDGVWAPGRRQLTVGLALAVTVVALEAMAVATILPIVARHLGDLRLYGWVFSAFMLSGLLGIVVAGTLADRGPLVRPMLAALVFFAVGLLIGGAAPDMPVLVAGRALQGLGAGAVPAIAYVAISRGYTGRVRPKMFAVLSTAWVAPSLVGPAAAAVVAVQFGWRWVFLGLIPVVGVAGMAAARALRSVPPPSRVRDDRVPYLPVLGTITGAATMLGTATTGRIAVAVPGVVFGAVVLVASLRHLTPSGTLTARQGLPATVLTRGLLTFAFYAAEAYVPYALTTVRHAAPLLAGVAFFVSTLTWTAGSWMQARVVHRLGPRWLVRTGTCVMLAGVATMGATLVPLLPAWLGVVAWGIAGGGMGLAYSPLSLTTLDRAQAGQAGRATSGLQVSDTLGEALGTGGAGAIVAAVAALLGSRIGVALAFSLGAGVGLIALFTSGRLPARLGTAPRPTGATSTRFESEAPRLPAEPAALPAYPDPDGAPAG
jgi:MFS family permease